MADLRKLKNNNVLIILLGVLCVFVLINILVSFQNKGIESVTGLAVEEPSGVSDEEYNSLLGEVSRIKKENEKLIVEKNDLSKKIDELEAEIKVFEEEKEIKEETCPLPCGVDELCAPINKNDGSVEWQCVDDPKKFV